MPGNLTTYGADAFFNGEAMPLVQFVKGHVGNPGPDALANVAAEDRRFSIGIASIGGGQAINSLGSLTGATAIEEWTHLTLWDDGTVGNPWWVAELPAPLPIAIGETIRLVDGLLVLTFVLWS